VFGEVSVVSVVFGINLVEIVKEFLSQKSLQLPQ
jgi:hypothetical protein